MNDDLFAAKPLCFVLMPFGTKGDLGSTVEFDDIYEHLVKPAVEAAGMSCLRADEEQLGGFIHRPMFERLLVCDYAVADLTQANANVYYELGIRHAARPWSTVLISAKGFRLPFDLAPNRVLRYELDDDGRPCDLDADRARLTASLRVAREKQHTDSPLFEEFAELWSERMDPRHLQAFHDRVALSEEVRGQLDEARGTARAGDERAIRRGVEQVKRVHAAMADLDAYDDGVLIDLLLAYRDFRQWQEVIALVKVLPAHLARSATVREQLAMAYNRLEPGSVRAERELRALGAEYGNSSETLGILGRVYKDRWTAAQGTSHARAHLKRAIDTYVEGFELDSRDPYPGVNAVHLLWISDRDGERLAKLLPVVEFAARTRVLRGGADYWDYATMIELSIYAGAMAEAVDWMDQALGTSPSTMATETTHTTIARLRTYCVGDDELWDALLDGLSPLPIPTEDRE
ncbi:TRAFs-binding domain-containing protein [Nocardia asteroides]|uniref:TRAFs-binding domain-containing protein n=1 Tax=Nocardia asteroides TaxID=1824 RepID=UPI0037B8613E